MEHYDTLHDRKFPSSQSQGQKYLQWSWRSTWFTTWSVLLALQSPPSYFLVLVFVNPGSSLFFKPITSIYKGNKETPEYQFLLTPIYVVFTFPPAQLHN